MPMIFELPGVILIISISLFLFQRKKKELGSFGNLTNKFKEWFKIKIDLFPSVHQSITLCSGNQTIRSLYFIISLCKDFCISQFFFNSPPSQFIVTGFLKDLRPNFYIYKKRFKFKHAGLEYSKKYLLNSNADYQVFGVVNQRILDFISKYDLDIFYCSYVPKEVGSSPTFESNFYAKGRTCLLSEEFISEFMQIMQEVTVDSEKRIKEIKKKHMLEVEKFKEEEQKGFFEKMKREALKKK